MRRACPYCSISPRVSAEGPKVIRHGTFYRRSDRRRITRYRCLRCRRSFSTATFEPCYRQLKRHINERLRTDLCSGVTMRRAAVNLRVSRTTVARKLKFLAIQARRRQETDLARARRKLIIEFDDMETFEHTKCKPLSITVAVEFKTRRILGLEVSRMPAKGKLAAIARKKYGFRRDERPEGRRRLFESIAPLVDPRAEIKSDQNPHYPPDVAKHFPLAKHVRYKGRRGCVVGQGELKRGGFDPLFALNHTCASFRANVSRLYRRTWNTTKRPDRLADHLSLYMDYHNRRLKTPAAP